MATSESRLVITIDSRSAEQRAKDTSRALEDLERHGLGAQVGVQQMNRALNDTSRSATDAAAAVRRMVTGALAGLSAMRVIDIADDWGQYASRIRMATESTEEYERAQARMLRSSQATFRHINETREIFIQLSPVLRQMGMSLEQSMDAIDAFSGLLVTNAASGDRANAAMRALSVSLQKGKIDADQWMTIYSTLDSIVDVIATNTGKAADEIRRLGAEGKLSVQELAQALVGQHAAIMQQVEEMPTTVRDAMTNVASAFGEYIGQANEANGATATLADGIAFVGENIETIMNAALIAGGVALAAYASRTVGATAATLADIAAKHASAISERDLAAAQYLQTKATLDQIRAGQALTATRAQLTAATAAHEASERRLVAAQAGVASVGRGLLGLFGGPVGLVATLGLTAAGFLAIDGAAARSKISMEILNGTVEEAVEKLSRLAESQRRAAIATAESNYATAVKELDDALREVERGSLADGARAVARWRATSSDAIREVAEAAKAGAISYEAMDEQIVQMIDSYAAANGMSKEWVAQQIEIASRLAGASKSAGQARTMLDELTAAHDRLGSSAVGAASGVSALNEQLAKTDVAGAKYLEQLEGRALIAGLKTQREQLDALVKASKLVFAPEDLERARTAADRIDAANAATKSLTSSMSEAARAAKQLAEWLAEQGIATAGTEKMVQAYLDGGLAVAELTRQQAIEEQVLKSGEKARAAITAAIIAQARAADRLDVSKQINDQRQQNAAAMAYLAVLQAQSIGVEEGRDALEAYNAEQALTALLVGKTREEMEDLIPLFQEEFARGVGITRQTEAMEELNRLVGSTRTRQEAYRVELARLLALRPYAKTEEQVRALDRAIQELDRSNSVWFDFTEKAIERIDESFADMWRNVIDGSENAFDAMKGGFKQMLAEMAHAAFTRPIMITVGNSIMGTSRPGGVSDVWGGGLGSPPGMGGLFSGIGQALTGASFGASGLSLGAANIAGAMGGDALGTLIAMNGGWAGAGGAAASGLAGTLGAGLSALGSAMPYIGMGVLAYSLLKDAFKGETRFGAGYMIDPATGQAVRTGGPSGGDQQSAATVAAINEVWATTDRLAKLLGGSASGLQFGAGLEVSPEKGRSFVWSDWGLTPDQVSHVEGMRDLSGVTDGSVVAQEFAVELNRAVLRGLQMAGIDEAIEQHLSQIDIGALDEAGVQAVMANLTALVQLRDAMIALPFVPATAATFGFAEALAAAAGGADVAGAMLGSFYQNYYSDAERGAWLTEQLTLQFAELGLALPQTREEFRALVEANMALGEAGAQTVATLLGMEAALSSLLPAFDAIGAAVDDTFGAQMETVRSLATETNRLLGIRNRAGTVLDQINRALGGAGTFGIQREAELWAAMSTASYEQQIDLASELTSVVLARYNDEIAAAERLRDIGRSLRDYVQSLTVGDLSPLTMGERLAEAGSQYAALLAQAQAGDTDAMGKLQGAADAYLQLARDYYASSDAYTQIFGYVTSSLDGLGIQAETDAQRQLGVSESSLLELEELRSIAERAYGVMEREYAQSLQALQSETALLTGIGADTGRLHDIAALLVGLPAELAARLQPLLGGAAAGVVGGWYADAGFSDPAGAGYWAGQLQQRPGDQVRQSYLESLVQGWYQDAYGTDPDAGGWEYWVQQAAQLGAANAYEHWRYAAGLHGSHRDGLWSVPFDGYRAELHRGETVLPSPEADRYRAFASMPDWSQYGRNDDALVAEVRALRAEIAELRKERNRGDQLVAETVSASAQANANDIVEGLGESTSRNDWQQGNQMKYSGGRG